MKMLDKLQRRFGRFAIPNLTLAIIAGQVFFYLLNYSNPEILGGALSPAGDFAPGKIDLVPALVLQGQVWRLVTFVFTPPSAHAIFMIFAWYIFFLMGHGPGEHLVRFSLQSVPFDRLYSDAGSGFYSSHRASFARFHRGFGVPGLRLYCFPISS